MATDRENGAAASEARFRKWIGRLAVLLLGLWAVQILAFITVSVLTHYPATVGLVIMGMVAFCIVISFEVAVGSPLEFDAVAEPFGVSVCSFSRERRSTCSASSQSSLSLPS